MIIMMGAKKPLSITVLWFDMSFLMMRSVSIFNYFKIIINCGKKKHWDFMEKTLFFLFKKSSPPMIASSST